MSLSSEQKGVLAGMLFAAVAALAAVGLGAGWNPLGFYPGTPATWRLRVALGAGVLPAITLVLAIGRLASQRFHTPADIEGGGPGAGTERARLLQAQLQNTLEQVLVAVIAYAAWASLMPATWLSAVPLCSLLFGLGRVLFFLRYDEGAAARSAGFALTFYPSVLLLAGSAGAIVYRLLP